MTEYDEFVRKLENAKVIKYDTEFGPKYLVIEQVKGGIVHGQIASSIGANAISIDELFEKDAVILVPEKK